MASAGKSHKDSSEGESFRGAGTTDLVGAIPMAQGLPVLEAAMRETPATDTYTPGMGPGSVTFSVDAILSPFRFQGNRILIAGMIPGMARPVSQAASPVVDTDPGLASENAGKQTSARQFRTPSGRSGLNLSGGAILNGFRTPGMPGQWEPSWSAFSLGSNSPTDSLFDPVILATTGAQLLAAYAGAGESGSLKTSPLAGGAGAYAGAFEDQGESGNFSNLSQNSRFSSSNYGFSGGSGYTGFQAGTLLAGFGPAFGASGLGLSGRMLAAAGWSRLVDDSASNPAIDAVDLSSGRFRSGLIAPNPSAANWSGVLTIWNFSHSSTDKAEHLSFAATSNSGFAAGAGGFTAGSGNEPASGGFQWPALNSADFVPVPEPAAVLTALLLVGGIGWRERKKFLHVRTP